jgi:hypothetical protein
MSGSSRVDARSDYFHLSSESPCMNFAMHPDYPDQEQNYHQSWRERGNTWLERAKPILAQRFASLAAQPDPGLPFVKYDETYPLWNSYRAPETPPPWRVGFIGMSGPGSTEVVVAFSSLPSEGARERFRQLLIQDLAGAEAPKPELKPLPPPPIPPDRRLALRGALGILAMGLTFGFVRVILPDYGEQAGLLVNVGCWILLYLVWGLAFRGPQRLSPTKAALLLAVVPLLAAGHWNVRRVESKLRTELDARIVQRLGTEVAGDRSEAGALKQVEERLPGWPRALHRMLGTVDVKLPERSSGERYERPQSFGATAGGGPLGLTALKALRVSLRGEERLLALAENDRELFLAAWKKKEAEGK